MLKALYGSIAKDGTILSGSMKRFSCSKEAEGLYKITYKKSFIRTPVVVVTLTGDGGYQTDKVINIKSSQQGCEIFVWDLEAKRPDTLSHLQDGAFNFIVMS